MQGILITVACNKQNLTQLKLSLLTGGLTKLALMLFLHSTSVSEANSKIRCFQGRITVTLTNDNIVFR